MKKGAADLMRLCCVCGRMDRSAYVSTSTLFGVDFTVDSMIDSDYREREKAIIGEHPHNTCVGATKDGGFWHEPLNLKVKDVC